MYVCPNNPKHINFRRWIEATGIQEVSRYGEADYVDYDRFVVHRVECSNCGARIEE